MQDNLLALDKKFLKKCLHQKSSPTTSIPANQKEKVKEAISNVHILEILQNTNVLCFVRRSRTTSHL